MSDPECDSNFLDSLRKHDTPTVCNAIEVAEGKRGFSNFTKQTMFLSAASATPVVGFARTAKIAGKRPSRLAPEQMRERRLDYFRHMAAAPGPTVAVVEDEDEPDCIAAWWGEVHAAVHKGLGLVGAVTNGVMRDLDDIDPEFPVLAGRIGPSHAHCHVTGIGGRVEIFGMTVNDGDLVHADRHGAVVIPNAVVPHLQSAIATLLDSEQLILGPAREPDFDIEKLTAAWSKFEKSRT